MEEPGLGRVDGDTPVLDPDAARLTRALLAPPRLHQLGPGDGRAALREMQGDTAVGPGVTVTRRTLRLDRRDIELAVIRPSGPSGPLPAVVYAHGGRWMLGDADTHGYLVRQLAIRSGAVLVVPNYSRTPEARFPTAVDEIVAVLHWARAELGAGPREIALAGDGAGGTLAAAATLATARRGEQGPVALALLYPWLDARGSTPSHRLFAGDPILGADAVRWSWEQYCSTPGDFVNPLFSPALADADELVRFPPTLVVTADADVVRDEAEALAARLRASGVPVAAARFLGTVHDFASTRALRATPSARAAVRMTADFLAEALDR